MGDFNCVEKDKDRKHHKPRLIQHTAVSHSLFKLVKGLSLVALWKPWNTVTLASHIFVQYAQRSLIGLILTSRLLLDSLALKQCHSSPGISSQLIARLVW